LYVLGKQTFFLYKKESLIVANNDASLDSAIEPKPSYPDTIRLTEGDHAVYGLTVSKSNRLIEAQNRLSAREQKVLAACLALVNPLGEYPNGITVELTDQQLESITGIKKRFLYRFIDTAAKHYHSIPVETPGKKQGTVDYINIAHRSIYDPEERKLTITFHTEMEEHLIELARYTQYELQYLVKLTTKYAMRFYELLCRAYNRKKRGVQFWRVALTDLYFPLGITDINGKPEVKSYVQDYLLFRRRVLEPSIEQINSRTDLQVKATPYKRGKLIVGLTFRICKKAGQSVVNQERDRGDVQQQLVTLGVTHDVIERWLTRYDEKRILSNLKEYYNRVELGQAVTNPAAYLNFLVKNNVAALPDIANPYAEQYSNQPVLREFVRRIVVPIWWKLDQPLRDSLSITGKFTSHIVTSDTVRTFEIIASEHSIIETEALMDRDLIQLDWNRRYAESQEGAQSVAVDNQVQPMHTIPLDWKPSADALAVLHQLNINAVFIEDSIDEFVVYWRECDSEGPWDHKFIEHIRRQWAEYIATMRHDNHPRPIPDDWQPDEAVYTILALANIETAFAQSLVAEFVLFWREAGTAQRSWSSKFLQYIKYQWVNQKHQRDTASHQPGQATAGSLLRRLTDRSWAQGLVDDI
jgi:plasmid replication initiation protein